MIKIYNTIFILEMPAARLLLTRFDATLNIGDIKSIMFPISLM